MLAIVLASKSGVVYALTCKHGGDKIRYNAVQLTNRLLPSLSPAFEPSICIHFLLNADMQNVCHFRCYMASGLVGD